MREEIAELKASKKQDDDLQGIWMKDGKNGKYANSAVVTNSGVKEWLTILPNKFWTKKNKQPKYRVRFGLYTPKTAS
jgi:hypothetical protein